MILSIEAFRERCRDHDGYCRHCDGITRLGDTEPNADGYPCETCGGSSVCGVEWAMIEGLIEIADGGES